MIPAEAVRDERCACGGIVARVFDTGEGREAALAGGHPWTRLPDRDGLPLYGASARVRAGRSDRHRDERADLRNPAHGLRVRDARFGAYCPNCGRRVSIAL